MRFRRTYRLPVSESLFTDTPIYAELAEISVVDGPAEITQENSQRRIVVESNVQGRDLAGFVAEVQKKIEQEAKLPSGYYVLWGGAFQNQQRAMKRLMLIVPLTILLTSFLLYGSLNSLRSAALIILTLPFALIGGILGPFLSGQYLSVPASVGFIALLGVAVLNDLVLVSYIKKLSQEGVKLEEAILTGCERRLRPALMTASIAILGLPHSSSRLDLDPRFRSRWPSW